MSGRSDQAPGTHQRGRGRRRLAGRPGPPRSRPGPWVSPAAWVCHPSRGGARLDTGSARSTHTCLDHRHAAGRWRMTSGRQRSRAGRYSTNVGRACACTIEMTSIKIIGAPPWCTRALQPRATVGNRGRWRSAFPGDRAAATEFAGPQLRGSAGSTPPLPTFVGEHEVLPAALPPGVLTERTN